VKFDQIPGVAGLPAWSACAAVDVWCRVETRHSGALIEVTTGSHTNAAALIYTPVGPAIRFYGEDTPLAAARLMLNVSKALHEHKTLNGVEVDSCFA